MAMEKLGFSPLSGALTHNDFVYDSENTEFAAIIHSCVWGQRERETERDKRQRKPPHKND
jgi:hypothetical protein